MLNINRNDIPRIILNDFIQLDKLYRFEWARIKIEEKENKINYTIYFSISNKEFKLTKSIPVMTPTPNLLERILKIFKAYYIPIIASNIYRETIAKKKLLPQYNVETIEKKGSVVHTFSFSTGRYKITVYNAFTTEIHPGYLEIFVRKRNYEIVEVK